jgi:hypothetical protein
MSVLFLVERLNVYVESSGSRVARCEVGSKSRTYDFFGVDFWPVNVKISLLRPSSLSSSLSVYRSPEA